MPGTSLPLFPQPQFVDSHQEPFKGTAEKPFWKVHCPPVLCPHWTCLPGNTCLSEQGLWAPVRVTSARKGHLQRWDGQRSGGFSVSVWGGNQIR